MFEIVVWLLHAIVFCLAIGLAFLVGLLLIEVLAGCFPTDRRASRPQYARCSYAVVIPAHDEVGTIEHTLEALLAEVDGRGRVLVVADNCSDDTAEVSRAAGAEVVERIDPTKRGKGYALDFAMRHLAADPPDIVIILDADCIPSRGAIAQIVAACSASGRPIQARYELHHSQRSNGPLARVGAFAWRVKNVARPTGMTNLGLPCHLMGTGMAFPWVAIVKCHLDTGHLVEDMVLGLELTAMGHSPAFLAKASVHSNLPPSHEGQKSQRTRWETGHIQVISELAPVYFLQALRQRNVALFIMALDVCVPPLALLALLLVGATTVAGFVSLIGGPGAAFKLMSAVDLAAFVALGCAWLKVGRDILSLWELMMSPAYVLSKLPLYGRALIGQRPQWVRSRRD